jgi:ABC-type antimicrobial peptide transport system permease subunit
MMTFPAVQGDPVAALGDGGSVVLTQTAAQRLFGSRPALGKTIVLNNIYPLKVGAVIRDVPRNSSIEFDLVLPYALFEKDNELANHWEKRYVSTWVQLAPGARLETVNREMTLIIGTIFGYRQINYVADRPLGYETATAGLSLVEGRDFSPAFGTDSSACLINQAAVRKMNLKEPVLGARIYGKTVIGVLRDFVYNSPGKAIEPLIVWLGKVDLGHFLIRLANDGQCKVHLDQIGKTAKSLNPGYPFAFRFVNDEHQDQFKKDFGVMQLGGIFAFMAILISCLGLYGLASFLVEQRTREISIRKVLGASGRDLWLSLCSEMLKPVVLGFVVASPLTALAMYPLLSTADYHIPLSWWVFALAGAGTVLIALATVSYHGLRATRVNPARTLQNE